MEASLAEGGRPVVVDQQGNARTMSADEFLAADETRQGAQELGLTPDVRRAQETRSTPAEPDPIPSDLLQRLRDSGWTPPVEGNNPNPDPAQVDAIGQDLGDGMQTLGGSHQVGVREVIALGPLVEVDGHAFVRARARWGPAMVS